MRRRFENIKTVAGGKIPVFACSISAPTTTWRNPVPILGCRYRSNGATMAASYVLDEINNSKVCTMGGKPISCTIGDVFYYFFITEGSNQVPQLKLSPSTHLIHSIYKISTIGSFVPIDTYVEL